MAPPGQATPPVRSEAARARACVASAAGIVTAAALGDRLGRRMVFVAGLVLFTLASAGCALAPNAELLVAARAVQGWVPRSWLRRA